jgi:aspartate/methionine/tyrosine aminotransferase
VLALQALKLGRDWVAPHINALGQVRNTVHAALDKLGDLVEYPHTQGAFYVLMKLPGVSDALAFNTFMTQQHRVACIPGFAFGLTNTAQANYQRLSYGALDAATVSEGVQRYLAAVRAWYRA